MTDKILVFVTCASLQEASKIARAVVNRRQAACVNILQAPVQSIYRWKSKVESAKEFLMILKTSRRKFPALERQIRRLHSYEVPEIIALPIERGSRPYLKSVSESVASGK
ncbi:MAG TPA: divalent-cation tolerance protein CutA [Candidatus Acidoferrales bacterium]|nr:divalent-cation tolerance protein CutA [Candidatus Acidoferrales bacterium]